MKLIRLNPTSSRVASRRLGRSVTFLSCASRQLDHASRIVPDSYNRDRLHHFAKGLRDLCVSLSRIASLLEKGEEQ
jgi:hypothetical protein